MKECHNVSQGLPKRCLGFEFVKLIVMGCKNILEALSKYLSVIVFQSIHTMFFAAFETKRFFSCFFTYKFENQIVSCKIQGLQLFLNDIQSHNYHARIVHKRYKQFLKSCSLFSVNHCKYLFKFWYEKVALKD